MRGESPSSPGNNSPDGGRPANVRASQDARQPHHRSEEAAGVSASQRRKSSPLWSHDVGGSLMLSRVLHYVLLLILLRIIHLMADMRDNCSFQRPAVRGADTAERK